MTELEAVREELKLLRDLVQQLVRGSALPKLYEMKEAARLLGVSPLTVSRMVRSGELMPTFVRRKKLISLDEINRIARPVAMRSSGATPERVRFDKAKAVEELKALRAKKL